LACYQLALERGSNDAALWTNMGNALKDLKWMQRARVAHQRAIALGPQNAMAWYNYGISLAADNQFTQAVQAFQTAQTLPNAEKHNIGWELARCLLAMGDYAQGWQWYQHRFKESAMQQLASQQQPAWQGDALGSRHLLLWSEQGFGDVLQCLRFLPAAHALVGTGQITVALQPELLRLAQSSYPGVRFVSKKGPLPACDVQASLLELPRFFCKAVSAIAYAQGYLQIPDPTPQPGEATKSAQHNDFHTLRERFPGKLRVGVVWSGSLTFAGNADRALAPHSLLAHINLPGVQLFSLQKGPASADTLPGLCEQFGMVDLAPQLHDFADTAAAVAALDLVVMTDSSVAHLCGALGAPVWVLLAHHAHWLWLTNTDRSPWYASMRFFRQTSHGDWRSALDPLVAALQKKQWACADDWAAQQPKNASTNSSTTA
jgi:tetratricopeptide (TPR) repeat protein